MKALMAILLALGLLAGCIVIFSSTGFNVTWIMVLGTALWAGLDSQKLQLIRYKTSISSGPFLIFVGCALLWIICFPWYLVVRSNIKAGTAVLKEEATTGAGG
jgi:hypothetical protein